MIFTVICDHCDRKMLRILSLSVRNIWTGRKYHFCNKECGIAYQNSKAITWEQLNANFRVRDED